MEGIWDMTGVKCFLLTALVALVGRLSAFGYDFEADGIYYNVVSEEERTCAVTYGAAEYSGEVVIPSAVDYSGRRFAVTSIGYGAFLVCGGLTGVTIPESVTVIGENAFYGCNGLTSVTIPDGVETIGWSAFGECGGLMGVTIPNSVTAIEFGAFAWCCKLESVAIPMGVTEIGEAAFRGCSALASVRIASGVRAIGAYAFQGCSSLARVMIPNSVTRIEFGAFKECSGLVSVSFPMDLKAIERETFYGCRGLTSVMIPNGVRAIERLAFYDCGGLVSVTIPRSVTEIEVQAFLGCSGLREISCLNVAPPKIKDNTFEGVDKTGCVLKVPSEAVNAYKAADYWKQFGNIVAIDGSEGRCGKPTIGLVGNRIVASTATEGAKCYVTVASDDIKSVYGGDIELTGVYRISAYAHAEGMRDSETVEALLVWVNPTIKDASNVIAMEARKAVVMRTDGDRLVISGTERGEIIRIYDAGGSLLSRTIAEDEETIVGFPLTKGETYVIKYGERAVKIRC